MARNLVVHFRYLVFYSTVVLLGTALLFGFLWSDIIGSKTLFLAILQSLCMTTAVIVLVMVVCIKKLAWCRSFSVKDIVIISFIFFFRHYTIYGLVPFNASRSVSVMLVGYFLDNQDRYISETEVTDYINQEYFMRSNAVSKRLSEQKSLGHLEYENGKYKITEKGVFVVTLMGIITSAYNTDINYASKSRK